MQSNRMEETNIHSPMGTYVKTHWNKRTSVYKLVEKKDTCYIDHCNMMTHPYRPMKYENTLFCRPME